MLLRTMLTFIALAPNALADSFNGMGPGIVACGDVNKDGITDLLVASRDNRSPEVVWLLSGKDGAVLHIFRGPDDTVGFGCIVGVPGDFDGDGVPEIAISTSGQRQVVQSWNLENSTPTPQGFDAERRGLAGCEVFSLSAHPELFHLPSCGSIKLLKDRDGDSRSDLLFTVSDRFTLGSSRLSLLSGGDRNLIRQLSASKSYVFENDAITLGDVNSDGFDDVLAAIGGDARLQAPAGAVMLSGKDGSEIWRDQAGRASEVAWLCLRAFEDLDHDGIPEVLVGQESRWVRVLSGRDGHLLYEVQSGCGTAYLDAFATSLDVTGDADGDGVRDWVVGANEEWGYPAFDDGYVWLCSGKDGHRIRDIVSMDTLNGYDVCSLGDVDGDKTPDVALLIENAYQRWTAEFDPIVRVVSTKDSRTIWEKDTKALRATRKDLAPTPDSAPCKPTKSSEPR